MTETRIHRFAAAVAALLTGLSPLVAQTVPDTLRQSDRIRSRMDSLQKVMRGRKDTLRTLPAFFGEPLNEAADSPLVSGNPDDTLPARPVCALVLPADAPAPVGEGLSALYGYAPPAASGARPTAGRASPAPTAQSAHVPVGADALVGPPSCHCEPVTDEPGVATAHQRAKPFLERA